MDKNSLRLLKAQTIPTVLPLNVWDTARPPWCRGGGTGSCHSHSYWEGAAERGVQTGLPHTSYPRVAWSLSAVVNGGQPLREGRHLLGDALSYRPW